MTASLLCESICNAGRIQRYDRMMGLTMGKATAETKALLKACRYTPHVFTEHRDIDHVQYAMFRCQRCGAERPYGNVVAETSEV